MTETRTLAEAIEHVQAATRESLAAFDKLGALRHALTGKPEGEESAGLLGTGDLSGSRASPFGPHTTSWEWWVSEDALRWLGMALTFLHDLRMSNGPGPGGWAAWADYAREVAGRIMDQRPPGLWDPPGMDKFLAALERPVESGVTDSHREGGTPGTPDSAASQHELEPAAKPEVGRVPEGWAEAIKLAASWFRDYERQHLAKGTPDGDAKAKTNRDRELYLIGVLGGAPDNPPPLDPDSKGVTGNIDIDTAPGGALYTPPEQLERAQAAMKRGRAAVAALRADPDSKSAAASGEELEAALLSLDLASQHAIARRLASNVGYALHEEPHGDPDYTDDFAALEDFLRRYAAWLMDTGYRHFRAPSVRTVEKWAAMLPAPTPSGPEGGTLDETVERAARAYDDTWSALLDVQSPWRIFDEHKPDNTSEWRAARLTAMRAALTAAGRTA